MRSSSRQGVGCALALPLAFLVWAGLAALALLALYLAAN